MSLRRGGGLHGSEGLPVVADATGCTLHVFGGSSTPYQALHHLLWLSEEAWRVDKQPRLFDARSPEMRTGPLAPRPVRHRYARLASIVGYASTEFFHFLFESLPRLALLLPALEADSRLYLVVPATTSQLSRAVGFVARLLRLVLPGAWFDAQRVIGYADEGAAPGERLAAEEAMVWADWQGVQAADGSPTHCLTPRRALQAAAALVADARHATQEGPGGAAKHATSMAHGQSEEGGDAVARPSSQDKLSQIKSNQAKPEEAAGTAGRPYLIYAARRGVSMRALGETDEVALLAILQRVAAANSLLLHVFDGAEMLIEEAIDLFASATIVVGVHGGALSNILFCRPGAMLLELSVQSSVARHYEHAAVALGLRYASVPLAADQRGVAAANVSLPEGGLAAVEAALAAAFAGEHTSKGDGSVIHDEV